MADEKGTETPEQDPRGTPTEEEPEGFLGLTDDPSPASEIEADLSADPEPTKDEPTTNEVEEVEAEVEEEPEEIIADSPESKGKSRSQRRREQIAKDKDRIAALETQLKGWTDKQPQLDLILNDPEIARMAQNKAAGKPLDAFAIREKPPAPVRPTNFSRVRAVEDPESPDAKYQDELDTYYVRVEEWRDDKDKIESARRVEAGRVEKEQQVQQAQTDWWNDITASVIKSAQDDTSVPDDEVEETVAEILEVLADPEIYSGNALYSFAKNHLGRTEAVKKKVKPRPKVNPAPVPAAVTSDANIVKGWVSSDGYGGDDHYQDMMRR